MNTEQARRVYSRRPGTDLPHALAADPYWSRRGSTNLAAPAVPNRGRRHESSPPLNLTVYDMAARHDLILEEFIRERGGDNATVPTGRTALAKRAQEVAESSPEARQDYLLLQTVAALNTTLAQGDGRLLDTMTCPKCQCWGLLPSEAGPGRWRAACDNGMCAYDADPSDTGPDADPPTVDKVRTWSMWAIARNHLRQPAKRKAA